MAGTISDCKGFEWDEGNSNKNWHLHRVSDAESEEVFFNQPLVIASDVMHSEKEKRFFALGRTETDRWLFVAFVIRGELIRVIWARDMTTNEKGKYCEKIKRSTEFSE